ncbi:MAG: GatB/YqeY domain-containing protein [Patescibacteria group bacterium]|nr:GatB/YqeY domain-containing protein [Patescibacteria group bacterium]
MNLREKIQQDLQKALKDQEKSRLSVLRLAWDAIIKKEKEKRVLLNGKIKEENIDKESQLTDEELIQLFFYLVKKGKEAVAQFSNGGRNDLAEKEQKELEILSTYLPEQLGENEVEKMAQEIIKEVGAESLKDMGKVMGALMSKTKDQVSGDMASSIVKKLLS